MVGDKTVRAGRNRQFTVKPPASIRLEKTFGLISAGIFALAVLPSVWALVVYELTGPHSQVQAKSALVWYIIMGMGAIAGMLFGLLSMFARRFRRTAVVPEATQWGQIGLGLNALPVIWMGIEFLQNIF